jgi:hypothetical protein
MVKAPISISESSANPASATNRAVIAALHGQLAAETKAGLRRGMYYPVRWDPFSGTS